MSQQASLSLPTDPPRVQASNKLEWNKSRSLAIADFYTIGYSGRDFGAFAKILQSADIQTLIDIRHTTASMYKPAFAKKNLEAALSKIGIDYIHVPDLGVPRDIRGLASRAGTRDAIWEWYDEVVLPEFTTGNLHWFFNAAAHPVAFMCLEVDPTACHRHRLALALERHGLDCFDL